jgi:hypothetical protein
MRFGDHPTYPLSSPCEQSMSTRIHQGLETARISSPVTARKGMPRLTEGWWSAISLLVLREDVL